MTPRQRGQTWTADLQSGRQKGMGAQGQSPMSMRPMQPKKVKLCVCE
jgi:hypothetical protein